MKTTDQEAYNELSYYTLAHGDPSFIHQYIVDAFAAQNADSNTKPITLYFALAGLYLHIEKKYSGKEVQRAHMEMAKNKKEWPTFSLPTQRGDIMVFDVIASSPGIERDEMIEKWSASVWDAYGESHSNIAELMRTELLN